ncbi:DUF547 domain-containing protein [Flavobacterium sp. TSSA_36]|jgi:hypothetical protein|uniref:DUF547 domain-containing protein n=1 Tax=Flavobacterium sp. TSSA_36 TaxID=3447669 RepID=UPI003F2C4575
MKKKLLLILFCVTSAFTQAQTLNDFFEQTNEFLKKNVSENGKVGYAQLKKSPGELIYILDNIAKLKTQFKTKEEAKAFWINAYNLVVIKSVLEKFPIVAVNSVSGFFNEKKFVVAQQELTLNDIENNILRNIVADAGLHFVLCKGTNGDAPLLNAAYVPEKVNEQIKEQVKLYINNKDFYRIFKNTNSIELPKMFEIYKNDFVTGYFNEIDFINIFLDKKIETTYKVMTKSYDWSLNTK